MYNRNTVIPFLSMLLVFAFSSLYAQGEGKLLVVVDQNCPLVIDGKPCGSMEANKPKILPLSEGEHYVQLGEMGTETEFAEIVPIEANKQKVLRLQLNQQEESPAPASNSVAPISIEQVRTTVTGSLEAGVWLSEHPGESFPDYPSFYYAFEKGDEIVLDLKLENKKGTNIIEVATYPDGVVKFSKEGFQNLENVRIKVPERSIYRITLATNHAFDRIVQLYVARAPGSEATKNFNPVVRWEEKMDTTWGVVNEKTLHYHSETVQAPQKFYINGGRNATFMGGTSRIAIPVTLPPNTVNWYYEFSAYREESEIQNVTDAMSLAADISGALDQTGLLSFGLELLNQPPGGDICDIFLLDGSNRSPFVDKSWDGFRYYTEASRENMKSGLVRVQSEAFQSGTWYIGIKNPSSGHGVHVAIEIVAVVVEDNEKPVRKPVDIKLVKVPVMQ